MLSNTYLSIGMWISLYCVEFFKQRECDVILRKEDILHKVDFLSNYLLTQPMQGNVHGMVGMIAMAAAKQRWVRCSRAL